jgi:tRNA modification GTPase
VIGGRTIFALASGQGRAAIAVIRISGPDVAEVLKALVGYVPAPRLARRARFRTGESGEVLDDGIVLYFPAPHSFTGEDVAELQLHGGRAVVDGMLDFLGGFSGLRLAEPGEFTRRAFDHGKLDLVEVEGLADLVAAETAAQRRQALRQLEGEVGRIVEDWRGQLIRALAHVEAEIDFPEEGLPEETWTGVQVVVGDVLREIRGHLSDERRGERLRDGVSVVIIGPPNAGKSTLLNLLARREVAITSTIAGTTRDVIEVHLDLGGYPAIVADTAGLRESADPVEQEGIARARSRAATADLRLFIYDSRTPEEAEGLFDRNDPDVIVVANKVDLLEASGEEVRVGLPVSLRTGWGVTAVIEELRKRVEGKIKGFSPAMTRARHRAAMEECAAALQRFGKAGLPELAAEDLRLGIRALGRMTGRVDVEEILDVIFREFCIGK